MSAVTAVHSVIQIGRPESMSRRTRIAIPLILGAVAMAVVELVDPQGPWLVLVFLGSAIAAGEMLNLRPSGRVALPLSYAVFLVVVRAGTPAEVIVTSVVALGLAFILSPEPTLWRRTYITAVRLAAILAALMTYRLVLDHGGLDDQRWLVLLALVFAGAAEILVSDGLIALSARKANFATHGRTADLAIITTGALMAISYNGIEGHAGMGLWGPVLFAIPLLAAWFAFEQVVAIRRTHDQTIAALSLVPELAGIVRSGHATRVAGLSHRLGSELGLGGDQLSALQSAALLHHLGHLCLDFGDPSGVEVAESDVASKGAEILRQTEELTPSAAILDGTDGTIASDILRVASAYDEISNGDETLRDSAIEELHRGLGYSYDVRVLAALERI